LKYLWLTIAGIAIVVAAFFLWLGDFNKAFVIAALGMVAWFLNYRTQVKRELDQAEQTRNLEAEEPDEH
jgi:chromate transport protein ChrA